MLDTLPPTLPPVVHRSLPKPGTAARKALNAKIVETCRAMWNAALAEVSTIPDHDWDDENEFRHGMIWHRSDALESARTFGPHLRLSYEGVIRRGGDPKQSCAHFPDQVHAEIRMFPYELVEANPLPDYLYGGILWITEGPQFFGQKRDLNTLPGERHFHGTSALEVARAMGRTANTVLARRTVALAT